MSANICQSDISLQKEHHHPEGHSKIHCLQDTLGCDSETGGISKNHCSHHSHQFITKKKKKKEKEEEKETM